MLLWILLPLCGVASEHIPYSDGSGQLFKTTADLIRSFLSETPNDPELPAVIPSGHHRIPSRDFEVPHAPPTNEPVVIFIKHMEPLMPSRPVFNRSMHLRVDLIVPSSDYTETFDVSFHAESNTARTASENTIIFRMPAGVGKVQYLKAEEPRKSNIEKYICTKSPVLRAGYEDSKFPGLPNMKPFSFIAYKTDESRRLEHWQYVVIGKPGEIGAVSGESLNYTHDFFVYRAAEGPVPFRYTLTTDSSVLGPASDTYTHRYTLLPAPTAPLTLMTDKFCDHVDDQSNRTRRSIYKHARLYTSIEQ